MLPSVDFGEACLLLWKGGGACQESKTFGAKFKPVAVLPAGGRPVPPWSASAWPEPAPSAWQCPTAGGWPPSAWDSCCSCPRPSASWRTDSAGWPQLLMLLRRSCCCRPNRPTRRHLPDKLSINAGQYYVEHYQLNSVEEALFMPAENKSTWLLTTYWLKGLTQGFFWAVFQLIRVVKTTGNLSFWAISLSFWGKIIELLRKFWIRYWKKSPKSIQCLSLFSPWVFAKMHRQKAWVTEASRGWWMESINYQKENWWLSIFLPKRLGFVFVVYNSTYPIPTVVLTGVVNDTKCEMSLPSVLVTFEWPGGDCHEWPEGLWVRVTPR